MTSWVPAGSEKYWIITKRKQGGYPACCRKYTVLRKLDGKYGDLYNLMKHTFEDSLHGCGKICELLSVITRMHNVCPQS